MIDSEKLYKWSKACLVLAIDCIKTCKNTPRSCSLSIAVKSGMKSIRKSKSVMTG